MSGVAFVFPGQGSQKVGMGRALHAARPEARAVFAAADDALGFSLSKLCFEGPEAELTLTANAQPAILTTSVAALRVLEADTGLRPRLVAGHSLGEYSALVAADALRFEDAVRTVRLRGLFMQEAVPEGTGAMAAILGLGRDDVVAVCAEVAAATGLVVSAANLNGGGQVVIAGHAAAVDEACVAVKARGARLAKKLAVSAPFHCALMAPAAERLNEALGKLTFRAPSVPVITNVEAAPNQDVARVRELLYRQVTAPVRWEESVERIAAVGVTSAVEIGAGTVLAGLVRRIAPSITVDGASDPDSIAALRAKLNAASAGAPGSAGKGSGGNV